MSECAILRDASSLQDLMQHHSNMCMDCLRSRLDEKEYLFVDRPPTWIIRQQEEEAEAAEKQKEVEKKPPNKKQRVIDKGDPIETLKKLAQTESVGSLAFNVKKILNLNKDEAHEKAVELKREAAAEGRLEKKVEKEEAYDKKKAAKERPWQPKLEHLFASKKPFSIANIGEQKRYVAIISNYNNFDIETRFDTNSEDVKVFDRKMQEERAEFDRAATALIMKIRPFNASFTGDLQFILNRWRGRFSGDSRRFSLLRSLEWPETSKGNIEKLAVEHVLVTTSIPLIEMPNMAYSVKIKTIDMPRFSEENTRIENDELASSLAVGHNIPIVMDATTATHLLAPPTARRYSFVVPITFKQTLKDGTLMRVCYLSKPRPFGEIPVPTIHSHCAKYALKTTFVAPKKKRPTDIDEHAMEVTTTDHNDPNDILGKMISSDVVRETRNVSDRQYTVFTIGDSGQRMLIRANPNGKTRQGHVFSVQPKVEYLPDAGAMKFSDDEFLFKYFKVLLKGSDGSAVFHVHYEADDCLQLVCNRNVFPQHLRDRIASLTRRFSSLISELLSLSSSSDNYLLHYSMEGDKLSLYSESPDGDLRLADKKVLFRRIHEDEFGQFYHGMDDKRVLRWQILQGRAPCTFWPKGHAVHQRFLSIEAQRKNNSQNNSKNPNKHNRKRKKNN